MSYRRNHSTHAISLFPSKESLSASVLVAAVFFNAALAIVNAHVVALSQLDVSLVEAAISALALAIVACNFRVGMLPWVILLAWSLLLHLALSVANRSFSPKLVRDAIDIPIFIALGMVYAKGNLVRLFFWIQCAVLAVMLVELFFVDVYSNVFDVLSYYVNTRDWSPQAFWNENSTLFVSATRPGERFLLGFLGIHRASSVFLEPVSLGNYSILATAFVLAYWREISRRSRIFFVVTTLMILVGSDGRFAAVTCSLLVFGYFIFPYLPRYSTLLYLPGMLFLAAVVVEWFSLQSSGDDISGRLSGSISVLASLDVSTLLGLDPTQSTLGFDSGVSYFMITQSIFGLVVLWLFICLVPRYHDRRSKIFVHSICIYISGILLVSYSLFSIKTAALMWFMYGYLLPEVSWSRTSFEKYLGTKSLYGRRRAHV